jgi:hypothetical protein
MVARIHFCKWFLQSVPTGKVDPQLAFSLIRPIFLTWRGKFPAPTVEECRKYTTYS